jgi:RimJ/RimL family protein N-acetyltransferase
MLRGTAGSQAPEPLRPVTDGLVRLRPSTPADRAVIVAGRDAEFHRWLGPGSPEPRPTACVEVDGVVVGWVDYDWGDHHWLAPDEVNLGYTLFPSHRGLGYASRAVQLLMHHLSVATSFAYASLLIDPANRASLALADRLGFPRRGDVDGQVYRRRPVPPRVYSDGVATIRPPIGDDLDGDLEAKDEEQIRWLWRPGERESWMAMTDAEQREHGARGLADRAAEFGCGPKWTFSVDTLAARYVAYVDCDLANDHVPAGEANISYSAHPRQRGKGYVSRAVRLTLAFLADNTGCREAHILAEVENTASRRVATAAGAVEVERFVNAEGRTMIRHVVAIPRAPARAG